MKIVFNDNTELQIQGCELNGDELELLAVTTMDKLKERFSNAAACKRMTIKDEDKTIAVYDGYTDLFCTKNYTSGIFGVVMRKKEQSEDEKLTELQEQMADVRVVLDILTGV